MILALSLAGWAGVSGCTSGSGGPTTSTTSQTLSQQLAAAFCAHQTCCGGAAAPDAGQNSDASIACPDTTSAPDAGGAGSCFSRAELAAEQQLTLLATAYGEGLVTINVTATATCAAAYQTRACGGSPNLNVDEALSDPACAGLFTGYIPPGERCDMTAECVAGAYCLSQATGQAISSIMGGGTLGICFPYQQAGDTCNTTGDCAPPLTCNPTTFVCE